MHFDGGRVSTRAHPQHRSRRRKMTPTDASILRTTPIATPAHAPTRRHTCTLAHSLSHSRAHAQSYFKFLLASNGAGSSKYVLFPAHFRLMVLLGFTNVAQGLIQLCVGLLGPATSSEEHDNITVPILFVRQSTADRPRGANPPSTPASPAPPHPPTHATAPTGVRVVILPLGDRGHRHTAHEPRDRTERHAPRE